MDCPIVDVCGSLYSSILKRHFFVEKHIVCKKEDLLYIRLTRPNLFDEIFYNCTNDIEYCTVQTTNGII